MVKYKSSMINDYEIEKSIIDKKRKKTREYLNKTSTHIVEPRKPSWLKVSLKTDENSSKIKKELRANNLWTVCEEASCPNLSECWSNKTATIMILGGTCTRACKFCNVVTGNPKGKIDKAEITNARKMAEVTKLRYLVITSVDRDDLADFGAGHFAATISEINTNRPDLLVEVLIPDFNCIPEHMHTLARSNPFVIAQNIETVQRLTSSVRDRRAGYEQSLKCLDFYKSNYPHITTKSSLMLGLGETYDEIIQCMKDLRSVGVQILTLGQYLRPTKGHLNVEKYYSPQEFDDLKQMALQLGFEFVASGPLVRSSYKAIDYLKHLEEKGLWPRT